MPRWRRWSVLVIVSAALALITLDNSILYTALPVLTERLGATSAQSLWIINAYPLVIAGLLPGAGGLGDRIGYKRLFQHGLGLFALASLTAAFSPSPEILIGARGLLAVGAAAMLPATLALIRVTFSDERERTLAISIWAGISVAGLAAGPVVGGLLLEHFWWGSVFLVNVPVAVAASAAIIALGPPNITDPSRRWDGISSAQALLGLGGAVLAIKSLASAPPHWTTAGAAAVVAVVALSAFVRRQRRLLDPLIDFTIFTNRAFSAGVVSAGASIFAIMGLQFAITQRYQLVEGFTPLQAGLVVAVLSLGALPVALAGGAVLHRLGLLVLIGGGLTVAALGAGIVVAAAVADQLTLLLAGLLILGLGLGAAISVASTAIVGNVPRHRAGMAASIEEVSYEFGGLVAVAVLGSVLNFTYLRALEVPDGASGLTTMSPTEALSSPVPEVVDAAAAAMDAAFLAVVVAVAVAMVVGATTTCWLLRRYRPGTASQAHPGDH
ncbi:MFS transporter [Nesterenkonia sp. F]|uniref:MFS transporter n=1 Tax=Nesterenkonia sp. F TaxID=795955 RepID=UPI00049814E6|nr:MFS transporter [Nesterenkonia sp. F]